MNVIYAVEPDLSVLEFKECLVNSTLGERRPIHDEARLQIMLKKADIIITARLNSKLIGISRAVTDFSYCCYLSDLAVNKNYQKMGIGKKLIDETHKNAGIKTSLILLSSPDAQSYYPHIGMNEVKNGWIIPRET